MVPGFINIEPNDVGLLKTIDAETAAIMLEPVQGAGASISFPMSSSKVREHRNNLALIFDEV
jgi:acetylornithine/succinyldiaminopimelate/putrescine aminotransferase